MVLRAALATLAATAALAQPVVEETDRWRAETAFAPEVAAWPALDRALRASAAAAVAEFRGWAREATPDHPYEMALSDAVAFASGAWVSVLRESWAYTGGAHGNLWLSSTLWSVPGARAEGLDALLTPEGIARLSEAAREAVEAEIWSGAVDPFWTDAVAEATAPEALTVFTLAPADLPGKAAAIEVHFAPYAVGPYVMGANAVRIGWERLAPHFTDAGRALFAGAPAD